jgi:PQQ-like domain
LDGTGTGEGTERGVKVTHGWLVWVRRLSFAAVLVVAVMTPGGPAAGGFAAQCRTVRCESVGMVRWMRSLPGSWVVQNGVAGTTPAQGQAYAALGADVAAVGLGMTVSAYAVRSGQPLWTTGLTGFGHGAAIMSVRAWAGVVTVGVALPTAAGDGSGAGPLRDEVVLRATTGQQVRVYPAAQFGGAVAASAARTVIVGQRSVTSYDNRTGTVVWSRATGPVPRPWQVDGDHLYMAVPAGGHPGSDGGGRPTAEPLAGAGDRTALRRIDLSTGAERVIRPRGPAFTGTFSLAFGGVVLFADASAVRAYSETTGRLLWSYPRALPDAVDAAAGRLYLLSGNTLIEVNPDTGRALAHMAGAAAASSSGLYAVRDGEVLGIDHGALGKAWGYDVATQQVLWTSRPLPWPHYFVDLSGIGGSAPPGQDAVLLAICAQVGTQPAGSASPRCVKPELALLNR